MAGEAENLTFITIKFLSVTVLRLAIDENPIVHV